MGGGWGSPKMVEEEKDVTGGGHRGGEGGRRRRRWRSPEVEVEVEEEVAGVEEEVTRG